MRSVYLVLGASLAFGAPVFAEGKAVQEAATEGEAVLAAEAAQPAAATDAAPASTPERRTVLGPLGRDQLGRTGRIHTVQTGDTLWDLSETYLGTPWVWPSVWKDNAAITDPDLIHPGDHIWITAEEMRRVSQAEADAMIAAGEGAYELPAAMDGELDGLPSDEFSPPTYRYTEIDTTGFVGLEQIQGAATIVDSPIDRAWLGDHDEVVIGLGSGKVSVGDRFDVVRPLEKVFGVEGGLVLGHATRELGWLEVTAVHADSATAMIRSSRSEMLRGDRVLPREVRDPEIVMTESPEVEGHVVYTPASRLEMGSTDIVYLDRGTNAGLSVGNPLEIYRPLGEGHDAVTGNVRLPDFVVAKLLVVEAHPEASVAVVTHAVEEVARGDRFRGSETFEP